MKLLIARAMADILKSDSSDGRRSTCLGTMGLGLCLVSDVLNLAERIEPATIGSMLFR